MIVEHCEPPPSQRGDVSSVRVHGFGGGKPSRSAEVDRGKAASVERACGDEGPGNNSAGETAFIFSKPSVLLNRSFSFQKYYKLEKFIEQAYLNSNVNKALLEGPDFKGKVAREIRTMIKALYHSSRPYKDLKDSFTKRHNHLRANRLNETCIWFIGSQSFGSWLAGGSPRLLWCYGAPGRGKSTIA